MRIAMRTHFELKNFEPFRFIADGKAYKFGDLTPLAEKRRPATKIHEYVFKLPTGKHVYLTVVGDEDQASAMGIERGWYMAEMLSDENAAFMIDAMAKFTALYKA